MEDMDIMEFLSVFKRRKKLFLIVFGALLLASLFVAFRWSNYRSVATVEVAMPEISASAANGDAEASKESLADSRIGYLQQKVLSTGSLVEIITKFDLYPSDRRGRPIADLAAAMRGKIRLNVLNNSLAGSSSQKSSMIAFTLSFDYHQPLLAQQVTNEIVSRFLDEDIKQRRNQVQETKSFLDAQLKTLEESLAAQEKKIAEFRTAFGETRPEMLGFNQQNMTSMIMNLQNLDTQIATNLGTQSALQGQLAVTDPYSRVVADGQSLTTPTIQLRALKSEYATLTAKYGPEHPDVIKVSRQIAAMDTKAGRRNNTALLRAQIKDAQGLLSVKEKAYGPENPDIIELKKKIEGLETQLADELKKPVTAQASGYPDADNPVYLQTLTQLSIAQEQGKALLVQKEALQFELEKHQKAVVANPAAEQQMAALTRDYENAQLRYRELMSKKLEADTNEVIEQDRIGQRLVMINPPELPLRTQPARILFIVGGLFLSFATATMVVGARQLINPSVIGARHLESIVGAAPLITIPHIVPDREKRRFTRSHKRLAIMVVGALVVALIGFTVFVMPLDVLLSVIGLKLGVI